MCPLVLFQSVSFRHRCLLYSIGFAAALTCSPALTQTERALVRIDELQFSLPSNYEIKKVAGEGLTSWPMMAEWDSEGNLLVVESGGVESPIAEHNKNAVHRIVRLVDRDGDQSFDDRQIVVDKLPFTEGVLWYDNAIYACAPPHILKFSDSDKDGTFDKKEVWFDGQTITYCANDLHGPYLGRDGWIYWCKGAFGEQTHLLRDGTTMKTTAAHIFRRHPDGGPIEAVVTGGMDNPVEFAMSREGERFFTSTFLHHPGNGLRDGIAHGIYGGVYGKSHNVIDSHVTTGPLMPVMVELGPAAPSGLTTADRLQLFPEADSASEMLVATMFNLQKVIAYQLIPSGSTYTTRSVDILTAERIDFHPTDVLQDADGSILVIDTGGWYDLCCPTSKIDQKTANGGIYRLQIRSEDEEQRTAPKIRLPEEWAQVDPVWLTAFIHDRRPWVARCALTHLRSLSEEQKSVAVDLIAMQIADAARPVAFRLDALWALSWIESAKALKLCSDVLDDDCSEIRQAACHIVSLHKVEHAHEALLRALHCDNIYVRRAACEALGRLGARNAIGPILASMQEANDRVYQHSVTFSLIGIGDVAELTKIANAGELGPDQQQCVFTALRELNAKNAVNDQALIRALQSGSPGLADVAADMLTASDIASEAVLGWLEDKLSSDSSDDPVVNRLVSAARMEPRVIEVISRRAAQLKAAGHVGDSFWHQLLSVYRDDQLPSSLEQHVVWLLRQSDDEDLGVHLQLLREIELSRNQAVIDALISLTEERREAVKKLQYVSALPKNTLAPNALLQALQAALISEDDALNDVAIDALQRVALNRESAKTLLEEMGDCSPRSLAAVVEAVSRIGADDIDKAMLKRLADMPAAKTLSYDELGNLYRKRSQELQQQVARTIALLNRTSEDIESAVNAKLSTLPDGNPVRGMQVFRSQKAACASCHRVGYVGGDIGPELSKLGASRTREAILEAILYPSARLEQSYHSTKVLTVDGQVFNGIIRRYLDGDRFELQLTADKSVVIHANEVESKERSEVSIMPSGLADLLTTQELADVLAFLESAK